MLNNIKIIIRKAKKGDGKGIIDCFNQGFKKGFNNYTGRNQPDGPKQIREMNKLLLSKKKNDFSFVAVDEMNNKIIGSSMFWAREKGRFRHRGNSFWAVHPDYARKGIATKLVKKLIDEARKRKYKKIQAEVAVENVGSVKLAKKLGFKIEGRIKHGILLDDNRHVDVYIFGKTLK